MRKSACQWAFVVVVAAAVSGCSTYCHKEANVPLDAVPAVVQATIQAHTYGGTVSKVEQETEKCGLVYEAKVKGPDGQCSEINVAADGKLLKYKTSKKECKAGGDEKHHD